MSTLIVSGIYEIRNNVNGSVYVGSAVNVAKRFREHQRVLNKGVHHSSKLQRAWNRYGASAFTFNLIERVRCKQDLIPREQWWLDATERRYNICLVAGSLLGTKRTAESRALMSAKATGNKNQLGTKRTAEQCAHASAIRKDKKLTDKHRAAISAGLKGNKKVSVAMVGNKNALGKKRTAEQRAAQSAAMTGCKLTAETCAKLTSSLMGNKRSVGRKVTEATRALLSAAGLGRNHTDEARARISATKTGRRHTDQARALMSAVARRRHAERRAREMAGYV